VVVHTIKYPNTTAVIQLSNPNLSFYAQTVNSGATTNQIVYCGSYGVFVSGERLFANSPRWSTDNNKSGITAETVLFSIRNATSYNGGTNRALLRLNSISAGAASNSGVIIARLRIGATVGGSPSFAAIDGTTDDAGITITAGNSAASKDTAGTTATGGRLLYSLTFANGANGGDNSTIDLTPFFLFVAPTEILTVSAFSTASAAVSAALNWSEDS
jgi:hypothetical protein